MSLLTRINLALGAVFIVAALTAGYACRSILEANARREVFAEAGLMMDSALAIRDYTANEILPLLERAACKTNFRRKACLSTRPRRISCGFAHGIPSTRTRRPPSIR